MYAINYTIVYPAYNRRLTSLFRNFSIFKSTIPLYEWFGEVYGKQKTLST
jgi:hypothetical protein